MPVNLLSMKNRDQTSSALKQTALLGISVCLLATTAHAQLPGVKSSVDREIQRRQIVAQDFAAQSIESGAEAYETRDFESAFAYYKSAVDALPDAPIVAEQRQIALDGFARSAVSLAEQRISEGRFVDAESTLVLILEERYAPDYRPAKSLLAKVREPDYFNKTLTPQFIGKVEEVKQLLTEAEGHYQSGQYDKAFNSYERVLNLDPYNVAAARGKERVDNARQNYAENAYNQTRGEMLRDVQAAWELPVRKFGGADSTIVEQPVIEARASASMERKLDDIRLPSLSFQETTVREAIDFLRQRSIALDNTGTEPPGVNIVLKLDPASAAADGSTRITLSLQDVPLRVALGYIADAASLKIKVDPHAVLIVPQNEPTDILVTKEYKVPPGLISSIPSDAGAAQPASPFGAPAGAPTAERSGAREFLEQYGVSFPQGASANFLPNTSKLIVRNTQQNLDLIDNLLSGTGFDTPKQIEIESRFVEVSQNNLKELGADWLLGQFMLPFGTGTSGSGGTIGNQGSFDSSAFPIQDPSGVPIGASPINNTGQITAGNRSGTTAIQANAVDALLFANPVGPAPGILSLAGVFTNPQFQVVLRALDQKKGVDLMSAPKITARSGQTARIEIVSEFIYPTEFDPPQIPENSDSGLTPVTPSTPSSFDTRNLGVELEVQPQIGPDGFTIDLILQPRVTEFEGFINYGSSINTFVPFENPLNPLQVLTSPVTLTENVINQPIFSVREITTEVSIYDGETVALGGLLREDIQKTEDRTPILGDIPLIGRAFRTDASQHIKRNLVIFTTVRLVDPAGQPLIQAVEDDTIVAEPSAIDLNSEAVPGDALSIP